MTQKQYPVVRQDWIESELGWGQRPDGYSLHKDTASLEQYVKQYWAKMPTETPDEYSFPAGNPSVIMVDAKTYRQLQKYKGIRY